MDVAKRLPKDSEQSRFLSLQDGVQHETMQCGIIEMVRVLDEILAIFFLICSLLTTVCNRHDPQTHVFSTVRT
jgi:hypothetical protein